MDASVTQVRALTGALLSSTVSSVLTLVCRQAFKHASKGGEGGRAIRLHKWQRRHMLVEKCEDIVAELIDK